ncbi:MAG: hypothetical protein HYV29_03870 [Ignavibacteriales bacterium]|nr:hypothetical protein [Ignavibacteriales bacterium]
MLIDKYLPSYDVVEVHSAVLDAKVESVYETVRNFRFANSTLTSLLFSLRGLSTKKVSLQTVLDAGFILLDQQENEEFVLGLVGKFWTPSGCLQRLTTDEFNTFNTEGYAKAVWNFSFERIEESKTRIATETRVLCLDDSSRTKFKTYWFFVGPFSGIIRREILRSIKHAIEQR